MFPPGLLIHVRFSGVRILSAVGILVSEWGFCIWCQVSYLVRRFVGYGEILLPRYVVEFGGEFRDVLDQHQTPYRLFLFLCIFSFISFITSFLVYPFSIKGYSGRAKTICDKQYLEEEMRNVEEIFVDRALSVLWYNLIWGNKEDRDDM